MLQAPSSQLSRVCGHGHIKKFWLMQTQNESQACENIMGGSTRPAAAAPGGFSQWASHPSMLSRSPASTHRATDTARLSGLLTCAESLSPSPVLFSDHRAPASDLAETTEHRAQYYPHQLTVEEAKRSAAFRSSPPTYSGVSDASSRGVSDLESTDSRAPSSPNDYRACGSSSTETDEDISSAHQMERAACNGKAVLQAPQVRTPAAAPTNNGSPLLSERLYQKSARAGDASQQWDKWPPRGGGAPLQIGAPSNASRDVSSNTASCSPQQQQQQQQHHQKESVRTCSICGTSKTPLWRSGPKGPKSLCNACGIRYKKSRRLQQQQQPCGEAGSNRVSSSQLLSPSVGRPFKREQGSNVVVRNPTLFKRSLSAKLGAAFYQKKAELPKLCGPDVGHNTANPFLVERAPLPRSIAPHSAKDEDEAAVLLMYLSCGLVYA